MECREGCPNFPTRELYNYTRGGEVCLETLKIGIPKPWDLLDLLARIFSSTTYTVNGQNSLFFVIFEKIGF